MASKIIAYSDGSCDINKKNINNKGGYAGCIFYPDGKIQLRWGRALRTTNNRMEIQGAISVLENTDPSLPLLIYSDSEYLVNGAMIYLKEWTKKSFLNVLNDDLWRKLDDLIKNREVVFLWVKGHSDNAGNNLADRLCQYAIADKSSDNREYFYDAQKSTDKTHEQIAKELLGYVDYFNNTAIAKNQFKILEKEVYPFKTTTTPLGNNDDVDEWLRYTRKTKVSEKPNNNNEVSGEKAFEKIKSCLECGGCKFATILIWENPATKDPKMQQMIVEGRPFDFVVQCGRLITAIDSPLEMKFCQAKLPVSNP